jgi:hypothetical protein
MKPESILGSRMPAFDVSSPGCSLDSLLVSRVPFSEPADSTLPKAATTERDR